MDLKISSTQAVEGGELVKLIVSRPPANLPWHWDRGRPITFEISGQGITSNDFDNALSIDSYYEGGGYGATQDYYISIALDDEVEGVEVATIELFSYAFDENGYKDPTVRTSEGMVALALFDAGTSVIKGGDRSAYDYDWFADYNISLSNRPLGSYLSKEPIPLVDESSDVWINIESENLQKQEQIVYWKLSGAGINDDDFDWGSSAQGSFRARNGETNSYLISLKADAKTEGLETATIKLYADSSHQYQVGETVSFAIKDTSLTPLPLSFELSTTDSNLTEGGTLIANYKIENFRGDKMTLYWQLSGDINSNDFNSGLLSGSFTQYSSHSDDFKIITKIDGDKEGVENVYFKLFSDASFNNQLGETVSYTINDAPEVKQSIFYKIEPSKYSVNEGEKIKIKFSVDGLPWDRRIYYELSGLGIDTNDFNKKPRGYFDTDRFNPYIKEFELKADELKEGNEIVDIKLYYDSSYLSRAQIRENEEISYPAAQFTISDTSNAVAKYKVTTSNDSISEGGELTLKFESEAVPVNSQKVYWALTGDGIDGDDFLDGYTGSYDASNSKLTNASVKVKEDRLTEGDEKVTVKLYSDSSLTKQIGETATFNLYDTSKGEPIYSISVLPIRDEGKTLSIDVTPLGLTTSSQTIYWSTSGTGITSDDFSSGATGLLNVSNGKTSSATLSLKADQKKEGNESFDIKFFSDSSRTQQIGETKSVEINDVSNKVEGTFSISVLPIRDEGETLTVDVTPSGLTISSYTIYWSTFGSDFPLPGIGITSDDFSSGATGLLNVSNGKTSSATLSLKADNKTEGKESFDIKFFADSARTQQIGETKSVEINDVSKRGPTYSISVLPIRDEGETLSIDVTPSELTTSSQTIYWSTSGTGITSDDFSSGATGLLNVSNGKTSSATLSLKADNKKEGNEFFDIKFFSDSARTQQIGETKSVEINDVYNGVGTFSISVLPIRDEGETLTVDVTPLGLTTSSQTIYWSTSGTGITSDDFSSGATGLLNVSNGKTSSATLSLKADQKKEGNESFDIKFFSDSSRTQQIGETKSVEINDTSDGLASHIISPSRSSVDEGGELFLRLTSNVDLELDNQRVYWALSGYGLNKDDFLDGYTGSYSASNSRATNASIKVKEDKLTEGTEIVTVKLYSDSSLTKQIGDTATFEINDTSKETQQLQSYSISASSSVDEGNTLSAYIKPSNLTTSSQIIYWSTSGTGITSDDFSSGATGSLNVSNGKTSRALISIKEDKKTEEKEIVNVKFFADSARTEQIGESKPIQLQDTSKKGSISYSISSASSVKEGETLSVDVTPSGLTTSSQTIYWSTSGTGITSDDFSSGATGSLNVSNGKTSRALINVEDDKKIEGREIVNVKFFSDSSLTKQLGNAASALINDSAKQGGEESQDEATYNFSTSKNSVAEGEWFNVIGQTTGLKKWDLIYWNLSGNGIDANDLKADHNSISGQSFVKDDGSFSFSLWPVADSKTEGNETINIRFYSDAARTTQIGNTPSVLVTDVTNDTYLISTDKSIYNEGDIFTFSFKGYGEKRTTYWQLSGDGIDSGDFDGYLEGTTDVADNHSSNFNWKLENDKKTEGDETVYIKLFSDSARTIPIGSIASATIKDTSIGNEQFSFSAPSSIDEGKFLSIAVEASGLSSYSQKIYWKTYGDGITSDDFTSGSTGSLYASNTSSKNANISIKSDQKTEGDETLKIKFFSDSGLTKQIGDITSVVINDTSKLIESSGSDATNISIAERVTNVVNTKEKIYMKLFSDYKFYKLDQDRYVIKTEDGYDEITGVNTMSFEDKEVNLIDDIKETFDQVTGLATDSGRMFRLYNAAFARFPDADGLRYWIGKYSSGENDSRAVSQSFLASNEFAERYGENITDEQYVTTLYQNVLGRAPDTSGLNYWLGQLSSGAETRYEALLGFAESAENKALFAEMTGFG
ncbi:DUF4214 domain-containing protein [Prochlorococcus sp. MIT 0916]|uniref:DUF4214 domain-containing protein n=1 Tax=Prochlorococcus sp. MIT 0916 TaxID=3082521 RepID=UPI0039B3DEAD